MKPTREHHTCNLCGSSSAVLYAKAQSLYSEEFYDILRCVKCNFVYVFDSKKTDWRLESYRRNESAVKRYENKENRDDVIFSSILKQLSKFNNSSDVKLLDVGCGIGTFLKIAGRIGWDGTGLDPNIYAVEYATSQNGLKVISGTLEESNFPPESFDVITLIQTLEHVQDPLGTLKVARKLIKPNGIIYIEVPNLSNIGFLVSRLFRLNDPVHTLDPTAHRYYFTSRTLSTMLKNTGFTPLEVSAGFNKSLLDIFIKNRFLGNIAKAPYDVIRHMSRLLKVGLSVSAIATKA